MIVLLRNFKNIFNVPDLRKKVFFTFFVLAVYRLGVHIPVPGINTDILNSLSGVGMGQGFMGFIDMFSGGALRHFAIFALGMVPYINASIMMQILSMAIPQLQQLSKEGAYGRHVINQYTRYLALGLSVLQGFGIAYMIEAKGLALTPGWGFRLTTMFFLSVGALFVMWLGEQINAHGIGNGSSMIIFAGIVSGLPAALFKVANDIQLGQNDPLVAVVLLGITLAVISCVVFLEKGERRVPVHYARKVVGNRMYGGQTSYIPFKLNSASVIPVIFSGSILSMLMTLVNFGAQRKIWIFEYLFDLLGYTGPLNFVLTAVLIIFFTFFYTSFIFDPQDLAENIRKSGGFIPGIRPGGRTAQFFDYLLTRVTVPGSIYLATLAIAPRIIRIAAPFPVMFDGISLLIVIGVALDVSAQIESYLIERKYDGFLSTGRLKGRAGR